jgi:cytoskeletal protein CcmA (bactofilin family)
MFNKNTNNNNDMSTPNQPMINMISEGTKIKGEVISKTDIRIAGTVDGEVNVEGKCILTNTGNVKGNISAQEADISGTVNGEVKVASKLVLRKSAKIKGNIHMKSFLVEEGAVFEGSCKMSENPLESRRTEVINPASGNQSRIQTSPRDQIKVS